MSRVKQPGQKNTKAAPVKASQAGRTADNDVPARRRQIAPEAPRAPEAPTTTVRIPAVVALTVGALLLLGLAAFLLAGRQSETAISGAVGQLAPVSTLQASDYHSLVVSPQNGDQVWFGSHDGIQESTDGGRTWQPLAGMKGDAMSMAMPPGDPSRVYIAGHEVFKRSNDGGKSWQDVQTDLPGLDIHGFAADPVNADHVYALVAGQGLFESADGGSKWKASAAQLPGALGALAVVGGVEGSPPAIHAATQFGLMRSQDGGKTWHRKDIGLPQGDKGVRALVGVPSRPKELYAGTGDGLYHSSDEGVTWRKVGLTGQDIYALAVSYSDPLLVYALSSQGAVYRLEEALLSGSN